MASLLSELNCRNCAAEAVYMDLKEEATMCNVGVSCSNCGRDYGVIDRLSRERVENLDEVFGLAEESVRDLLEP